MFNSPVQFKKINSNHDGFTLLELIMVIAITIIFLCFITVFPRLFERHKLYSAAAVMAEDIRLAQQLSINQDGIYTVVFDCWNDSYYIQRDNILYQNSKLPGGIKLAATNFDFDNNAGNGCDNRLMFNSRGEPFRINGYLYGGHIIIRNKNGERLYVIVASITGRVRIDKEPPS